MSGFWPPLATTPAIYATVLQAFLRTNLWVHGVEDVMRLLVEPPLESSDVGQIPQGIAGTMPLLHADHERMRCALSVAQLFDLFEAAEAAVDLAEKHDDYNFMLAAASLCGNPAVSSDVRGRVSELVGDCRMVRIRFDPCIEPTTPDEDYLYSQCWPGVRVQGNPFATPPVVVIDCLLDPSPALRLAVRVLESVACVQRLAPESEVPLWFGSETVLIATLETSQRVRDACPEFPEHQTITNGLPNDSEGLVAVLGAINRCLPEGAKLRIRAGYS